jgi:ribosomal protein L7/L12
MAALGLGMRGALGVVMARQPFMSINIEGTLVEVKEQVSELAHTMGVHPNSGLTLQKQASMSEVSQMFKAFGSSDQYSSPDKPGKIPCIKVVRECFGCSLKDAKDIVEGNFK